MESVKPYTYFSQLYSHLMKSVDYKFWAEYISEIHQTLGNWSDIALELGSGNCSLAKHLNSEFKKLFLSDISLEMLKKNRTNISSVCCDMAHLPFKNKFDFIFSAFDSVNYLRTEEKLKIFFLKISNNLNDDGILLFDVALKNNSLKYQKDLNRKGKYKGVHYVQKSEFDEEFNTHTNSIEIRLNNGSVYKEVHTQKIYDFYYYFEVLESAGLVVLECFDAFTFDDGTKDSDRIQFIVKKVI